MLNRWSKPHPTVLITGANRGLGLEFTKQYLAETWNVMACYRQNQVSKELSVLQKKYSKLKIINLDVTSATSMEELKNNLGKSRLDLLINNAGIYSQSNRLGQLNIEDLVKVFLTNAVAPLKLSEILIENLKLGELKIIANISSIMGSLNDNHSGGAYGYRAGKAALNMFMKTLSFDLEPLGIKVVNLHPGWVKTDMGGDKAPLEIPMSVQGMRKVIQQFSTTGSFYDYLGHKLPW